ncbi:MAG: hypothetical protein LBL34_03290 [Clostridiales bacterium]|jgi:hypothetical protein|nr:hypothetical protein [Clostridiales bacterium]
MLKRTIYAALNLLICFGVYYFTLPAINVHSMGFWLFLITIIAIWTVTGFIYFWIFSKTKTQKSAQLIIITIIALPIIAALPFYIALATLTIASFIIIIKFSREITSVYQKNILYSLSFIFTLLTIAAVLSSPVLNSQKYRNVADISNKGTLSDAFPPIASVNELDILTMQSSSRVGDRILGQMAQKYISQFEVNNEYNLIYLNNTSLRVTPLEYGSFFKYLNNKKDGIPAYLSVNVTNQTSSLQELGNKPIKYAPSAYFNDNLIRHLRFRHPTLIFGKPQFELDDDGYPYYIVPTKTSNAGMFGAMAVSGAVLCNATTGDTQYVDINSVPKWVDHVYSVYDINEMSQWHYNYVHGYFNFGKQDMRNTSFSYDDNQYSTIAKDNDIFMITGITSVGGDESNVGFIMANLRTGEISYYDDPGAEESSAQGSAQGLVQQFGYRAVPPKLVNIDGISTYYMPLYDSQGIFRKYAFVNKANFTKATEADSLQEAFDKYRKLILPEIPKQVLTKQGIVSEVYSAAVDGNTYFYFSLNGDNNFYVSSIVNNPKQVRLKAGSSVKIEYEQGTADSITVKKIDLLN